MLNDKEVRHIAQLAKLTLTREELIKFGSELSEVLEYINILNDVPTENITPTFQVTGIKNVFRDKSDPPSNGLSTEKALRNARKTSDQYFVVPPVLENA